MTTYYFIAASKKFLTVEEPLEEILKERERNYKENNKDIDFWLVVNPKFLNSPNFAELASKIPNPPAAVISKDKMFIDFLKLRLEFVVYGKFEIPNEYIKDPLATD